MELGTNERLETLAEKLHQHGLRRTPQRTAVLKALVSNPTHPRIEEIFQIVVKEFPMISLATIYKTISTLKEIGEVRELGFNEGGSRYDSASEPPHAHLICVKCQKISDVEAADLTQLSNDVYRQSGYQIVDQRLDFLGVCPTCQSSS